MSMFLGAHMRKLKRSLEDSLGVCAKHKARVVELEAKLNLLEEELDDIKTFTLPAWRISEAAHREVIAKLLQEVMTQPYGGKGLPEAIKEARRLLGVSL